MGHFGQWVKLGGSIKKYLKTGGVFLVIMAKKEEKPKHENLDDFIKSFEMEHSKSLDDAFKAYDSFNKEENILHYQNNVFAPGQDALYETLVKELDKSFDKKDETKLDKEEHHKKVKKAVGKALRSYFEKVMPSVVKSMDEHKMNEEDQYEHLISIYDSHTRADPRNKDHKGLRDLVDSLITGKKTVGHVKHEIYEKKSIGIQGATVDVLKKFKEEHLGRYMPHQIGSYLKPKFEKAGRKITDPLAYLSASVDKHLEDRETYLTEGHHPYLKKKEEEKKK